MQSHEVDYQIYGNDMQVVEVELDHGETVIAEAGAMNWMDDGIIFEARMGDGSSAGGFLNNIFNAGKRLLTRESLFLTHFTNGVPDRKQRVALAGPYPGQILPIDLQKIGGQLTCQKDAFLCAALGTRVEIAFTRRLGAGFFGGEGFILQRMVGDGMAFIHAGGSIIQRELQGERIRVDTGALVGFAGDIDYDIEMAGNLKSMFFGGEGLFLATLRGTGTVYLQTMPFARLANRIIAQVPHSNKGEGD